MNPPVTKPETTQQWSCRGENLRGWTGRNSSLMSATSALREETRVKQLILLAHRLQIKETKKAFREADVGQYLPFAKGKQTQSPWCHLCELRVRVLRSCPFLAAV